MFRDLAAVESDPDTVKSTFDRNGSHTAWYIKCYGEYASVRDCVDDNWSYSENKLARTCTAARRPQAPSAVQRDGPRQPAPPGPHIAANSNYPSYFSIPAMNTGR